MQVGPGEVVGLIGPFGSGKEYTAQMSWRRDRANRPGQHHPGPNKRTIKTAGRSRSGHPAPRQDVPGVPGSVPNPVIDVTDNVALLPMLAY